jgi:alkyldihydroxyacetonephosphate synthase
VYEDAENEGREEILKCGGSLSHHHGIGKIRKVFASKTISPLGIQMLQGQKKLLDPKNIFSAGNIFDHPDYKAPEGAPKH